MIIDGDFVPTLAIRIHKKFLRTEWLAKIFEHGEVKLDLDTVMSIKQQIFLTPNSFPQLD